MVRVLKPSGKLVMIDMEAADEPLRKTEDEIETLRDPSHVKNLSKAEMLSLFETHGLAVEKCETTEMPQRLENWLALTQTPDPIREKIRQRMQADITGHDKTGFSPYLKDSDIFFDHKWVLSDRIKKIGYPMLADPTHVLSRNFEVYIEADGVAERGTFIVNPEGKIVAYEVNAGNVGRNADELLRKLQACQFVHEHGDEVCPAKWQPGTETLKPSLDLVGQL